MRNEKPILHLLTFVLLAFLPITANGQWEHEEVTTGGLRCDIAVDSDCLPHISYSDNTVGHPLKYAHWNGTEWQIAVIESNSIRGIKSIALDDSDIPHVAFMKNQTTGDQLWHAWWDGTTWQQEGIDSLAWTGAVGYWNSITFSSDGYPRIAYTAVKSSPSYTYYVKYATQDASGWHTVIIDSQLTDEYEHVSLDLDSGNNPHISYSELDSDDLKYAVWDGNAWNVEIVDSDGDVGQYSSIGVGSTGYPQIAYVNYWSTPPVKYAYWDGTAWQTEGIDSEDSELELYSSMALDSDDQPQVSYGGYYGSLKCATKDVSWQVDVVDESVECGWTSIAVDDSGLAHIVYYDATLETLNYAKKSADPQDETPPSAPQSLLAVPGNRCVYLSWAMNEESDVEKYRIYVGTTTAPTTCGDSTLSRLDTTATVTNLTAGVVYYFRVTAVDGAGNESDFSDETNSSPTALELDVWYVATDGSDDTGDGTEESPLATIQQAISLADEQDTVLVLPGVYNMVFRTYGKNLVIGSLYLTTGDTSYISQTVVDGGGEMTVASFENDEDASTLLCGMTLRNGSADTAGGVSIANASPTLSHLVISGNSAEGGGGIWAYQTSSTMSHLQVLNNTAEGGAGGIYLIQATSHLSDIMVRGNTAEHGGGIYVDGSSPTLERVTIIENSATGSGGGIAGIHSNPTFIDLKLLSNESETGAGFSLGVGSSITMDGALIRDNRSSSNGGGFWFGDGSLSGRNIYIVENSSGGDGGGMTLGQGAVLDAGIFIAYNSAPFGAGIFTEGVVEITSATIMANGVGEESAGIYVSDGNLTISHSNLVDNGLALYNESSSPYVNAANNWWGSPDGPYHAVSNPTGSGDTTGLYVDIEPWLTSEDASTLPLPPNNLRVIDRGANTVTLAWDESDLEDLDVYRMHYRIDGTEIIFPVFEVGPEASCTITGLPANVTFLFECTLCDTDGNESWYSEGVLATTLATDSTPENGVNSMPTEYGIAELYPNPFNPVLNVTVGLPQAADLRVNLYNVMGQQVAELADGRMQAGYKTFLFDGSHMASGVYFVQAVVPGKMNQISKVVLMK